MRTQCLQVRERRFDAQGLRIEPPGDDTDQWIAAASPHPANTTRPPPEALLEVGRKASIIQRPIPANVTPTSGPTRMATTALTPR